MAMEQGCRMKRRPQRGFTLIEMVIVLVIGSILATIGYGAYIESVRKGRRVEGQKMLQHVANMQEVFFTENQTYTTDLANGPPLGVGYGADPVPSVDHRYYLISVDAPTVACPIASCYQLRATPNGAVNVDQVRDGVMILDSLGRRARDKNQDGDTVDADENCWESGSC